jgi:hypothetical protein
MKITRAILVNILFTVGASIATLSVTPGREVGSWIEGTPRCIEEEPQKWKLNKEYHWSEGQYSFTLNPDQDRSKGLKVACTEEKNKIMLHNNTHKFQEYAIQDVDTNVWFHQVISPGVENEVEIPKNVRIHLKT